MQCIHRHHTERKWKSGRQLLEDCFQRYVTALLHRTYTTPINRKRLWLSDSDRGKMHLNAQTARAFNCIIRGLSVHFILNDVELRPCIWFIAVVTFSGKALLHPNLPVSQQLHFYPPKVLEQNKRSCMYGLPHIGISLIT